ncbi:MAG: hypothetical protein Q8Q02_09505 [Nocardioides sp.]|nr:hypothetical protein [Nocardioides sp.]
MLQSLVLAAESAEGGMNAYLVGGLTLAFLLALLFGLVSFAAGRDHS